MGNEGENIESTDEGIQEPYCPKCGTQVTPDMKFCANCGTPLGVSGRPPSARIREGRAKMPDILGFASVGVILILLALTYIRHPINASAMIDYLGNMGRQGVFIKPPLILLDAVIFFFYAAGVWGIILSGLRIVLERDMSKALSDLVGGFFSLLLAYLATNYRADIFTGRTTLAYFIVGIGLVVIVNAVIYFAFPRKRGGAY